MLRFEECRKDEIKKIVFVTPTGPQPLIINKIEDYGLKYS